MSVGSWIDRKVKMVKRIVTWCFFLIVLSGAAVGGLSLYGFVNPPVRVEHVQVPIEVEKRDPSMDELIEEAPRMGMEKPVAITLLKMEDGGKNRREAKRCEWDSKFWLEQANKITKDPEQRDAYRCSYGPFQVAAWHAPKYGKTWADLLDLRVNFEIAGVVWGNCKEAAKAKKLSKVATYRDAFRCYNGSGPMAERYADRAMDALSDMAVTEMLDKLEG
ncbi:hypothetical protein EP7_004275 [Isosphaeraceae bacterium EP7]